MPITDDGYEKTTVEEIKETTRGAIKQLFGADADTTPKSVFSSLTNGIARTLFDIQEDELKDVYESAYLDLATGEDLDRVVKILGIERRKAAHATGVIRFSRDSAASQDYPIQSGTIVQTDGNDPERFETTEPATLQSGNLSVDVNIRHIEGGPDGNVGANSIVVMPNPPVGVDGASNPDPTGDPAFTDTDGNDLIVGAVRETDEELRTRAKATVTKGGSATVDAVLSAILNNPDLPTVNSVRLYNNRGDSTDADGLPGKSFELVIHGGDTTRIGEAIFNTIALTDRPVAGIHGTEVVVTVEAINGQLFDVRFSRPTQLDIDISLEIVHDDTYIGDDALRDLIVEYIGGVDSDGNERIGTGVGEDVYHDKIEDIVIGEDTGVVGIKSFSTTPAGVTNANGLIVVDVGDSEVGYTNATDGSIAITTTAQ